MYEYKYIRNKKQEMLVVRFTNNKRGAALMAFHTLIEIVPVWENRIDCLASGPVVPSHNVSQKSQD